jgi:hypothetical protein
MVGFCSDDDDDEEEKTVCHNKTKVKFACVVL